MLRKIGILILLVCSGCLHVRTMNRVDETSPVEVAPQVTNETITSPEPLSLLPEEFRLDLRFQRAEAAEREGRFAEALNDYRSILHLYRTSSPRAAAYALYRTSFCYEGLGDDVKAILSLVDAYNRQEDLPPEIAYAEIPARLGFIYSRLGREEFAQKHYDLAAQGLNRLKAYAGTQKDSSWIVKTLTQMGSLNLNQLSEDNFVRMIQTFSRSQNFLVEAIDLQTSPWSDAALQKLETHYMGFWNFMTGLQAKAGADPVIAKIELYKQQSLMAEQLLESIVALRARWLIEDTQKLSPTFLRLSQFAESLEREAENFIIERAERLPLTPEAVRLQELKREFKVLDVAPAPVLENIPELTLPPPPTDPNL